MTFDTFIQKWNGKKCTHPNGVAGQCVCLYRCYLDEVLNVPQSPPVSGARLIFNTYLTQDFDRIFKSALAIPRKGDIVIFNAFPGNPYGHVGMCVSANLFLFTSFDSNWSTPLKARIESHNYRYVLGWLRKKPTVTGLDQVRASINDNFLEIYKRPAVKEDNDYYLSRIGQPAPFGIHTEADLRDKMKFWYAQGEAAWLKERTKVLNPKKSV